MKHAAFIGRRFLGKSTLAYHEARQHGGGLLIFDVKPSFTHPRFRHVVRDVAGLEAALREGRRVIVYRPVFDLASEFCEVSKVMWQREGFAFLLDESSFLNEGECPKWLGRWARLSPASVSILQTAHRVVDIPPACRVLLSDWFFFKTVDSLDLDAIRERLGSEIAEQVARLPHRHVLHVEYETGRVDVLSRPHDWRHEITAGPAVLPAAKVEEAYA